jgi:hypothetical protein
MDDLIPCWPLPVVKRIFLLPFIIFFDAMNEHRLRKSDFELMQSENIHRVFLPRNEWRSRFCEISSN